jgi:hypothetical protein
MAVIRAIRRNEAKSICARPAGRSELWGSNVVSKKRLRKTGFFAELTGILGSFATHFLQSRDVEIGCALSAVLCGQSPMAMQASPRRHRD